MPQADPTGLTIAIAATKLYVGLCGRHPDWQEDAVRCIALHIATPPLVELDPWLPCENVFQHSGGPWEDLCIVHVMTAMSILVYPDNPDKALDVVFAHRPEISDQIQHLLGHPEEVIEDLDDFFDIIPEKIS